MRSKSLMEKKCFSPVYSSKSHINYENEYGHLFSYDVNLVLNFARIASNVWT